MCACFYFLTFFSAVDHLLINEILWRAVPFAFPHLSLLTFLPLLLFSLFSLSFLATFSLFSSIVSSFSFLFLITFFSAHSAHFVKWTTSRHLPVQRGIALAQIHYPW